MHPAARILPPPVHPPRLIGARYQLINDLGRGAMGSVHRVLDRLTGRVVTLKQLRLTDAPNSRADDAARSAERLALAREFRVLSSLRHPNIISVLDYGFDGQRPYLTMDLEENARTILEAARAEPLAVQIELLVQTLRALVYLHRHGIIHRDLKPANILVVKDQVKVLDFGFSVRRHGSGTEETEPAGTLLYMAPELLYGEQPSERSDLWAVGIIAYELLCGAHPFANADPAAFYRDLTQTVLPRPSDPVDPRLRPILASLLAVRSADRFADATLVIGALEAGLGRPIAVETVATRESFLQAAPLVGREDELATLFSLLQRAATGHGGACLVGGESGVGKSRLLDEVRTQALVEGVIVVRGQAVSQGGGPYHVWREVLRSLVLRVDLSDAEAAVLRAVIPDIAALLGREIEDSPAFNPDTTQSRLLLAVEEVVRRQQGTVLVLLEDLQWAGSESLRLLEWLSQIADRLRLLLLGSFRNDEAPDLPRAADSAEVMVLRRLERRDIAALAESMIGMAGCDAEVTALLERETEGIPFFVVEVVRALAENAGGLSRIGHDRLPMRVVSGGMQRVVRRRLGQVRPEALPPLEAAAVIGRTLDLDLVRTLHPALQIDDWLAHCMAAAVLELQDQRWQFVHDKLRDQLLDDLGQDRRRALHRCVAEALEREHPERGLPVAALAHHWRWAGEPSKEERYADRAGLEALESGASREAVTYLKRVIELIEGGQRQDSLSPRPPARPTRFDPNAAIDPDGVEFQLGAIEGKLCEAYFRLGDLEACRRHGARALALFGQGLPGSRLGWLSAVLQQSALRCGQSVWPSRPRDIERARRVAPEVVRTHGRLLEASFYELRLMPIVWSCLRVINHSEPAGPSPDLARGYLAIGLLAALSHVDPLANRWQGRALEIAEQTGSAYDVAWILSRIAVTHLSFCRWTQADATIERAMQLADDLGDLRLWEECRHVVATAAKLRAQYDRALTLYRKRHRSGRASGSRQTASWDFIGQAEVLARLGRHGEALRLGQEASASLDERAFKSETIMVLGASALASRGVGDRAAAYEAADHALALLGSNKPIAHWLQPPMAAIAEVALASWEHSMAEGRESDARGADGVRAQQVCAMLRRLARLMPLARPHACLWEGLRAWLAGRPRRAMRLWQRSLVLAESMGTPYEGARAHYEIGRHLAADDPERPRHLREALDAFSRLGCAADASAARALLPASSGGPAAA